MADEIMVKLDDKPVRLPVPVYKGRTCIYAPYDEITADNVYQVLQETLPYHWVNAGQINYLWNYYKGDQPILNRTKEVRPEINNKVVENHAQEIVAFKIGYQLAEPLQYTCRMQSDDSDKGYEEALANVTELNTLMFAEDKASHDRDLFEWMCICGVGYRMCEADTSDDVEDGSAPFEIYTLDPRDTFAVYSSSYHHRLLMTVWVGKTADKEPIFNIYTDREFYRVIDTEIVEARHHSYGHNPIVEYKLNNARMGVFEPVLPLLDAINSLDSNRLDDIEQTVQALMVFKDCDITYDDFETMREIGAVKIKTLEPQIQAAITILTNPIDQTGTQQIKEDLYQSILNICGMPNRNGQGSSTSDTGAAVLLRDGWTLAESHAKSYELQFKRAERDFLRVALSICAQSASTKLDLRIRDIELAFNRRNYENIQVKSQVLTTMLSSNKIHPQLAFQSCGLFTDPDAAYKLSDEYATEQQELMAEQAEFNQGENAGKPATQQPASVKGEKADSQRNQ